MVSTYWVALLAIVLELLPTVVPYQVPRRALHAVSQLKLSSDSNGPTQNIPVDANVAAPKPAVPRPAPPAKPRKAQWFPFGVNAPSVLDDTLAADFGFDPLGIVKSKRGLYWMREAEVKHARLAMLAAVGWPMSELLHKELAQAFQLQSILAAGERAPSLLNGGLDSTWATGMLMMSIIVAGYLEGRAMNSGEIFWASDKPEGYVPGTLGFDPLGLYNARGNKKDMEAAEIKNGRLAMLAVTAYVVLEATTKMPVVQLTPFLF